RSGESQSARRHLRTAAPDRDRQHDYRNPAQRQQVVEVRNEIAHVIAVRQKPGKAARPEIVDSEQKRSARQREKGGRDETDADGPRHKPRKILHAESIRRREEKEKRR